jgi:phospholipid transport system substrate-binding protein
MRQKRRMRFTVALYSAAAALAVAGLAHAADPQTFIQSEHTQLLTMLHQPASPARDAQVNQGLDTFVDYDEITRRTFGAPCHPSLPGCEDLWSQLDAVKRSEVTDLMRQLVRKTYRKNLMKTLNFAIVYKGMKPEGSDTRVLTEAKDVTRPRDPPSRIDYVVRKTVRGFAAVDFVTEDASMTRNYYTQFRGKMHNPAQGYPDIVAKLRELIAKP